MTALQTLLETLMLTIGARRDIKVEALCQDCGKGCVPFDCPKHMFRKLRDS
jgi:hypothetical protein